MACSQRRDNLFGPDGTVRFGVHRVISRDDLLTEPSLDRVQDDPPAGRGGRRGDADRRHPWRARGTTAYMENGDLLEHAHAMAGHASARTTKLYDRRGEGVSLDEVERILL